jgi:hypothetical protein
MFPGSVNVYSLVGGPRAVDSMGGHSDLGPGSRK